MAQVDLLQELVGLTPLEILSQWIEDARRVQSSNPNAFSLATIAPNNTPTNRVVLCKEVRKSSILFFTNYESHKGQALNHTPFASANFYWDQLVRQIILQGKVEKTSRSVSVAYWQTRPRESQLSQSISKQSTPVESRKYLEDLVRDLENQYHGKDIPCPNNWGGYELFVDSAEVWIGRPGRLHDRFCYTKVLDRWDIQRLCP
jgi:pyridoxamine 5'-phosphate oxidase